MSVPTGYKFYECKTCGNVVEMITVSGVPVVCCGEEMEPVIPNSSGAAEEKHLPVFEIEGNRVSVQVGEVMHPMTEEHHIEWIYMITKTGAQCRFLKPGMEPKTVFLLENDEPKEIYAFCNLHGLWKIDV